MNARSVRFVLLLLLTVCVLTGCIPPQGIALGLLIPVVILLVLACVLTSYFPGVGRLTLALTHLASLLSLYTFPSLTVLLRVKVRSNYALSLISASVSGLILFVSAVVLRNYGEALPAAWQCGLFGFLLFFMINLGYYLTQSEMTFIEAPSGNTATEEDKRQQFVLRMLLLDQLHYLNFLFAPPVALLAAWWMPQADRLTLNVVVTLGLFVLSIALAAVVKGSLLSFGLKNEKKSAEPLALYTRLTDLRVIMFYSVIHDFLVASFLTFAIARLYAGGDVIRSLKIAGAFGGLMAIVFGLLPFFFGQKSVVDMLAQSESRVPADREVFRQKLVKVRPLIPKSLPLTGLFGLLTAGGIFSYLIDLLGK